MRLAHRLGAAAAAALALAAAMPAPAYAHSRSPTIALDVRLRVEPMDGVRPEVIDGNRLLRLTVDPARTAEVRGLLGEPFLRFDRGGVWANRGSPTTAADRIGTSQRGTGWVRVADGHRYTWHDHRLAAPPGRPGGSTAPFSLPLFLDGRETELRGTFTYFGRPAWWPWLVGAVVALAAVLTLARARPRRRSGLAWATAALAAIGAVVSTVGFATGGSFGAASLWVEAGVAALLVAVAGAGAVFRGTLRTWTASLVGAAVVVLTLRQLVVFWHGVVISSLAPTPTRLAVAVAIVGGLSAAGVSFSADDEPVSRT